MRGRPFEAHADRRARADAEPPEVMSEAIGTGIELAMDALGANDECLRVRAFSLPELRTGGGASSLRGRHLVSFHSSRMIRRSSSPRSGRAPMGLPGRSTIPSSRVS